MNKIIDKYYQLKYAYFFKGKEGLYNEVKSTIYREIKEVFRVR